ncbi:AraC family transcriptional regulator [Falsiruegeria mediterranea]|uniref:CFA/I fimbrial subunit D n=1 Tax=Falsiruegeria mediterranea M17 TaxID=1200281 RepID=A0A2R8CCV6_9RHOB|nr:AraC family transcriptional regulator [Falsiruegeria mediterranea]SPJ30221.1 CFA/I fimbrial subunit D [Falsiruegeria mediterranea M17]
MSDSEFSAFLLAGVLNVCDSDGVSAEDVLAAGGVTPHSLQVPGATVLRSKAVAVFDALSAVSHRPDAAFRAGLYLPIERSSELVQLFRSAPDLLALVAPLNAALGSVCGGLIGVSFRKDYARLGFGFPSWNIKLEEPFQEAAAGAVVCALRTRFGPNWRPVRVLMGHRRLKPEISTFEGIQLVFGTPDNAVILRAEEAKSEPRLSTSTGQVSKQPEPRQPRAGDVEFANEARRVVHGRLLLRLGAELEDVSKVFGISGRTLKRRLSEEETSLSSIVEGIRLAEAERLLIESSLPVTEISGALGYAHLPSFTRAFKRVTGRSPFDFRHESQSPQG